MSYQTIQKPASGEYESYFQNYIDLVSGEHIIQFLVDQFKEAVQIYRSIDPNKIDYRYAAGKWSVKEVIIHILDTERIFTYRALRIARKDKTPLPGFDQDDYINNTDWDPYSFNAIVKEYELVRNHTINFFDNMDNEMLAQKGISSESELSVRAIPFIIGGHERHHLNVLKQRYL